MKTKLFILTILFLTLALILPLMSSAAIPHLMNFQGKATDKQGAPLNGTYNLTFRIYNIETGGTPKWTETQTNVSITNGIFQVQLGSVNPLNLPFDESYWISIEINTDGEMSPRTRLASVPYAYTAEATKNNLPRGGTTGQALVKKSDADFDAEWILPTGYSNVIFEWHGWIDTGNNYRGLYIGDIKQRGSMYYLSDTYGNTSEGYQVLHGKFIKLVGISTITVWARLSTSNQPDYHYCDVYIGNLRTTLTSTVNGRDGDWVCNTLDVSLLTNGTTYDIAVKLRSQYGGYVKLYGIMIFGS